MLDGDRDLVLQIGSDDAFKCWLNGEAVGRFGGLRGFMADEDQVPAKGRARVNTLLVKIAQGKGNWAFNVRLTDSAGQPVRFVRPGEAE